METCKVLGEFDAKFYDSDPKFAVLISIIKNLFETNFTQL